MNILKNVVNKLAEGDKKTELASQKVELGLMQDAISEYKQGIKLFQDAKYLEEKIEDTYKDSLKFLKEAQKKSDKIKANAKDLGLDLPQSTVKLFSRIDGYVDEAEKKSR